MIPIRFPSDNVINRQVSAVPLHAKSASWVARFLQPDKRLTTWTSGMYGMGVQVVGPSTPWQMMEFVWPEESDAGRYPLADSPAFNTIRTDQSWAAVDAGRGSLYEIYSIFPNQNYRAYCGAWFNLNSNELRPDGWTSASESGMAFSPLLLRYDEVHTQEIRHALAVSLPWPCVANSHVWPARHHAAPQGVLADGVPIGTRMRLRGDYVVPPGASIEAQRIMAALRDYGAFVTDRNGTDVPAVNGQVTLNVEPNANWGGILAEINSRTLGISEYIEFIDESAFMADPNSGRWRGR